MFEAAAEAGVHAFQAGGEDEEIVQRLESQGVERWLARRLVTFLPIAFGRHLLRECAFEPDFVDGDVARPLESEPVYGFCLSRAERADRTEMERIALRSAAVNAANQLLSNGSQLSDLQFSADRLVEPLPPARDGDGGVPAPRSILAAALREHGVAMDDSLRAGQTVFDARMFVHEASERGIIVQLDVAVSDPRLARPRLIESVAGYGGTWKEAIGSATATFLRGSFHAIAAALLDPSGWGEQVAWEDFEHPSGGFRLCLGPQLNMFQGAAYTAGPLLGEVLAALRGRALTPQVHWLRLFSSVQDGRATQSEALLDNETWPEGQAIIARHAGGEGFRTSRLFGMLVP